MTAKFSFDFDIAYTYSLDALKDDLLHLAKDPSTHFLIDPLGPGGGNTNVKVNTDYEPDFNRIKHYAELGPPCKCDSCQSN